MSTRFPIFKFIEINRIIYKSGETEALYCYRQIVDGELYAHIQFKTFDGEGRVAVLRPRFYIREKESWAPLKGTGVYDLDKQIIFRLNELEPAV